MHFPQKILYLKDNNAYNSMKKLLLSSALCLLCFVSMAQGSINLATRDKPLLSRPQNSRSISVGLYYMFDSFQTGTFHNSVSSGLIKANGGLGADVEFGILGQFGIEAGGFACMYNLTQDSEGLTAGDYWRYGLEAYLNWHVLPYLGAISNWLDPYIGAGYQTSSIKAQGTSSNTSAPMLQAAIRLNLGAYYFNVVYRQAMPIAAFTPQMAVLIGGGVHF